MTGPTARRAAALLASLLLCAGCSEVPVTAPSLSARVEVDTPELREQKRAAGIEDCPTVDGHTPELPDVTLPCLGGGREVDLQAVEGPAVLAVWAQWCAPCREELPWYQRLHERAGQRLQVLGIDWQDVQPQGALALAGTLGVTFPSLADVDARLDEGRRGLPLAYFVAEDGAVTLHRGRLTGYRQLAALVERHTGVRVRGR